MRTSVSFQGTTKAKVYVDNVDLILILILTGPINRNHAYRLWCARNPGFEKRGRVVRLLSLPFSCLHVAGAFMHFLTYSSHVPWKSLSQHILAHSLGSALVADILSNQPTHVPPLSTLSTDPEEKRIANKSGFLFDTQWVFHNSILLLSTRISTCQLAFPSLLFNVGSPLSIFLRIQEAQLIARKVRKSSIELPYCFLPKSSTSAREEKERHNRHLMRRYVFIQQIGVKHGSIPTDCLPFRGYSWIASVCLGVFLSTRSSTL